MAVRRDRSGGGGVPPADVLTAILQDLRVTRSLSKIAELRAPWRVEPPAHAAARFHVVAEGSCFLRRLRGRPVRLGPGDLAFVPRGEHYVLLDSSTTNGTPDQRGSGPPTVLLCTTVDCEGLSAQMLLDVMPAFVCVRAAEDQHDVLRPVVKAMTSELLAARPGGTAVMTRLADVLVITAVRWWLHTDSASKAGWLDALRHPQIGRAVALIHERPQVRWSLASLARAAAMSRSSFAAHFARLVGLSPMQYVTRVKMHRARMVLRSEPVSIAALAAGFGYDSDSAFSRAFKRHVGVSPGSVSTVGR